MLPEEGGAETEEAVPDGGFRREVDARLYAGDGDDLHQGEGGVAERGPGEAGDGRDVQLDVATGQHVLHQDAAGDGGQQAEKPGEETHDRDRHEVPLQAARAEAEHGGQGLHGLRQRAVEHDRGGAEGGGEGPGDAHARVAAPMGGAVVPRAVREEGHGALPIRRRLVAHEAHQGAAIRPPPFADQLHGAERDACGQGGLLQACVAGAGFGQGDAAGGRDQSEGFHPVVAGAGLLGLRGAHRLVGGAAEAHQALVEPGPGPGGAADLAGHAFLPGARHLGTHTAQGQAAERLEVVPHRFRGHAGGGQMAGHGGAGRAGDPVRLGERKGVVAGGEGERRVAEGEGGAGVQGDPDDAAVGRAKHGAGGEDLVRIGFGEGGGEGPRLRCGDRCEGLHPVLDGDQRPELQVQVAQAGPGGAGEDGAGGAAAAEADDAVVAGREAGRETAGQGLGRGARQEPAGRDLHHVPPHARHDAVAQRDRLHVDAPGEHDPDDLGIQHLNHAAGEAGEALCRETFGEVERELLVPAGERRGEGAHSGGALVSACMSAL